MGARAAATLAQSSNPSDAATAACEDVMDSSSDESGGDVNAEGEGRGARSLNSDVAVKSEPVHCEGGGRGNEPTDAGAVPVCGASSSNGLAAASSQPVSYGQGGDSTECSSSFGDSCCQTDDEADRGDLEANSPFFAHGDGDQVPMLLRKKKVTAEWRKAIRPMLWRCQWLELRMKDLSSQVSKYDRQLALIKKEKKLQQTATKTNGSRKESGHVYRSHENGIMERRKRKRHEDTVETQLYIKKHHILSYFYDKQNKGAEIDGVLIDDDNDSPAIGDHIKGGLDTAGLFEMSKEYNMVSEQLMLQKILLKIHDTKSQVHQLQERLSKACCKQEEMSPFVGHAPVEVAEKRQRTKKRSFYYKYEYECDQHTKPQKKKNLNILLKEEDRPALAQKSNLFRRPTDDLEHAEENSEDISGERSQSHKKFITEDLLLEADSSLQNGHMGDLCTENTDDILIENQAAKEGYQPFENIKHPLGKSPELIEKVQDAASSKLENTSAPVKVENTCALAIKQELVIEKRPALKHVYSKRGWKARKNDGGSGCASMNQYEVSSKTSTVKKNTETTLAAEQKTEFFHSQMQKTMNMILPAKKRKIAYYSAGQKQKAESSSSAARKEINENAPKARIEKAVLVAVNSRRSQRVRKPKIY